MRLANANVYIVPLGQFWRAEGGAVRGAQRHRSCGCRCRSLRWPLPRGELTRENN
jgi:hypothetical protein